MSKISSQGLTAFQTRLRTFSILAPRVRRDHSQSWALQLQSKSARMPKLPPMTICSPETTRRLNNMTIQSCPFIIQPQMESLCIRRKSQIQIYTIKFIGRRWICDVNLRLNWTGFLLWKCLGEPKLQHFNNKTKVQANLMALYLKHLLTSLRPTIKANITTRLKWRNTKKIKLIILLK